MSFPSPVIKFSDASAPFYSFRHPSPDFFFCFFVKNPILALFAGWDLFVICFRSVAEPDKSYCLEQSELAALFKQMFKSDHVGEASVIFIMRKSESSDQHALDRNLR